MRLVRRPLVPGSVFGPTPRPPGWPGAPSLPAPLPVPAAAPPADLGRFLSVSAREFSLTLSRPALAAGEVTIELRNRGEDPHNLVVSPAGSHTELAQIGTQAPLGVAEVDTRLAAGRYYLWCTLPGHEAAGMHAALEVR